MQVNRARAGGSPGPLNAPPDSDAAAPHPPGNGVALAPSLPSHVALGPVLHPSFQVNYHFNFKILLKLLVLDSSFISESPWLLRPPTDPTVFFFPKFRSGDIVTVLTGFNFKYDALLPGLGSDLGCTVTLAPVPGQQRAACLRLLELQNRPLGRPARVDAAAGARGYDGFRGGSAWRLELQRRLPGSVGRSLS